MIEVKLNGRLGNQMFQYAILRTVCKELGYDYSFSKNWLGKDIFDIDYGVGKKNIHLKTFNEGNNRFNPNFLNIKDNTVLNGYWQSEKYFKDYEFVRSLFPIKNKIEDIYNDSNVCIIHFRGGDYNIIGNYIPSVNWFNKAKEEILKVNENVIFKVITDDVVLAKEYFTNDEIISKDINYDYQTIYNSKYVIISASSFSWWASYTSFNKKDIIIAPNKWLNHSGRHKHESNGFYPFDSKTNGFTYL